MNFREGKSFVGFFICIMLFFSSGSNVYADEIATLATDCVGKKVIAVDLPVVSEQEVSPFNFIIDPQGFVYATGAARYGGGKVEEGATILFKNNDGEYDYSGHSDMMMVRNRSTVPVTVKVTATVGNLNSAIILPEESYENDYKNTMYMAIVDNKGNEIPITPEKEAVLEVSLSKAPENAYVYKYNDQNQTYDYVVASDNETIDWDSFSFGIKASCNPNSDWSDITILPYVKIQWSFEEIDIQEDNEAAPSVSDNAVEEDICDENDIVIEEAELISENIVEPETEGEVMKQGDNTPPDNSVISVTDEKTENKEEARDNKLLPSDNKSVSDDAVNTEGSVSGNKTD